MKGKAGQIFGIGNFDDSYALQGIYYNNSFIPGDGSTTEVVFQAVPTVANIINTFAPMKAAFDIANPDLVMSITAEELAAGKNRFKVTILVRSIDGSELLSTPNSEAVLNQNDFFVDILYDPTAGTARIVQLPSESLNAWNLTGIAPIDPDTKLSPEF